MSGPLELALLSCLLLGLRHGFDYDHLAAITDITSMQRGWRWGMRMGLLYALGHALTVAVLGVCVIALHLRLPARMDAVGERFVGVTLIVLAMYVLASLWRSRAMLGDSSSHPGHTHVSRSRIALLISGAQYAGWGVRRLVNPALARPEPFAFRYDRSSVFVVGMVHGLGAETPSQLLLFLLAAHLGGTSRGLIGLFSFIAGLLLMNTVMTASASGVFAGSVDRPWLRTLVTSLTAVYSLLIGTVFLFHLSDRLPPLAR